MTLRVSTKMESAWYMDPELLAAQEGQDQPRRVEIDADGAPTPDATVSLGDSDFEELPEMARMSEEQARHYREVSLKGALLAQEDATQGGGRRDSFVDSLKDALDKGADRLSEALTRSSRAPGSLAPPPPPELGGPSASQSFAATANQLAASALRVFEPGRVPPMLLAAVSFGVGVLMTLIRVILAL